MAHRIEVGFKPSVRDAWGEKIKSIGFTEGMTTFYKNIGPDDGTSEPDDHIMV